MQSTIIINVSPELSTIRDNIQCTIKFNDSNMIGCKAEYFVETNIIVDMKSGSNEQIIHTHKKFKIKTPELSFNLSKNQLKISDYNGNKINISTQVRVIVDGGIFSKDYIENKIITRNGVIKESIPDKNEPLIHYKDKKNFIKSIRSLLDNNNKSILKIVKINSSIILTLLITFLYFNIKWANESPSIDNGVFPVFLFFVTVIGIISSLVVMYVLIKENLNTWIKISTNKKRVPQYFPINGSCRVSDLILGTTSLDVDKLYIRIVACNMENGVYLTTTKSSNEGTITEAVCFNSPVREFVLFEKTIHNIKKGSEFNKFLDDVIYFENIYRYLYPLNMATKKYGINHYWEIQFIHDDFTDFYISLPSSKFDDNDFYN